MTNLQLAILKYLYKYREVSCLTTNGKIDSDNCEWAYPITKNMWNNSKSLDDFIFSQMFIHFLHYFVVNFNNEEIFDSLGFLLVNSYINQDPRFVTSYTISPEGEQYCQLNEIIPLKIQKANSIGFKQK